MNVTGCYSTSAEYDKRGGALIREQSTKRNEYRLVRDMGRIMLQKQRKKEDYWRGRENILQETICPKMDMELLEGVGL